jgi:L-ascorbate metabolism protein UlaG (beta-lactamase superfamily)
MLIKYIGHACFKVRDNATGYSIVFDPYKPGYVPGLHDVVDAASEVICSHDHFDHNYAAAIKLEPQDLGDDMPYDVEFIDTWHDPEKGALRGANRITIVTERRTGKRLVHYGDIGEVMDDLLTEENMKLLGGADVVLIPVGGTYTYDADQALALIERTSPGLVVPMHSRTDDGAVGFANIGSIEDFLGKAKAAGYEIRVAKVCFYDTDENDLTGILALRPQNA